MYDKLQEGTNLDDIKVTYQVNYSGNNKPEPVSFDESAIITLLSNILVSKRQKEQGCILDCLSEIDIRRAVHECVSWDTGEDDEGNEYTICADVDESLLVAKLREVTARCSAQCKQDTEDLYSGVVALLSKFRTIDRGTGYAVRCGNCVYYNAQTEGCIRNPSVEAWKEDDFCSYGKARGEG